MRNEYSHAWYVRSSEWTGHAVAKAPCHGSDAPLHVRVGWPTLVGHTAVRLPKDLTRLSRVEDARNMKFSPQHVSLIRRCSCHLCNHLRHTCAPRSCRGAAFFVMELLVEGIAGTLSTAPATCCVGLSTQVKSFLHIAPTPRLAQLGVAVYFAQASQWS